MQVSLDPPNLLLKIATLSGRGWIVPPFVLYYGHLVLLETNHQVWFLTINTGQLCLEPCTQRKYQDLDKLSWPPFCTKSWTGTKALEDWSPHRPSHRWFDIQLWILDLKFQNVTISHSSTSIYPWKTMEIGEQTEILKIRSISPKIYACWKWISGS